MSADADDLAAVLGILTVTFLIGTLVGGAVGGCSARDAERVEAMKVGAARWTADPATGEARFVYGRATP